MMVVHLPLRGQQQTGISSKENIINMLTLCVAVITYSPRPPLYTSSLDLHRSIIQHA